MTKTDKKYLRSLLETPSVTGTETRVASLLRERLAPVATEIVTDVMGSVQATLAGTGAGPRVMVAAHMDEVGFMVTGISERGFLSIRAVGGVDPAVLPGVRVDVHTQEGTLRGVVCRKPIHQLSADERKNAVSTEDLSIDLGLPAKKVRKQVRIGDTITYGVGYEKLGPGMAVSRGFDDKMGLYVATRTMEELAASGGNCGDFVFVGTTQEEIGCRGALPAAYAVNPAVGIALDVTFANDYPGATTTKNGTLTCGGGPVIARGPGINPVVFERLVAAAKKCGIPYQIEAEPGNTGTDATPMQISRSGCATALVSVAIRYMHTPNEVLCLDDLEATVKLLTQFVQDLDDDVSFVPGV